ncbi:hypothetical protein TNCV_2280511 [Trichonephila clavipes]|nr:hypothetical protein TNCV_2280511 [Trichonephila clavipes]
MERHSETVKIKKKSKRIKEKSLPNQKWPGHANSEEQDKKELFLQTLSQYEAEPIISLPLSCHSSKTAAHQQELPPGLI